MNLPKDFPKLEALREKMGAPFRLFVEQIDLKLRKGGVTVQSDEYAIVDEIPTVQNRKVVLYLQDAWSYHIKYGAYPKYHVVDCKTLQDMRRYEQYHKYHATRRSDGNFLVKFSDSDELSPHKLNVCKNCLTKLKEQYGSNVFPTEPTEFPLADWFERFDYEEELDHSESRDVPFDYSSEAWRKRSLACREKVNWTCQECDTNLEADHHLLHAHHQWGTKFNDPEDLIALCINCHAKQDGDGHQLLKHYPEYQEFMRKYGSVSRSGIRFNLPSQQPQQQSTPPYLQTKVAEDDIPF